MPWDPGETWPGTPGGASSPSWSEYLRLYVYAAIQSGTTFQWGPAPACLLDAGNVYGPGTGAPGPVAPTGRLWVDLSCDVLDIDTHLGGTRPDGAIATSEAGTARVLLMDPDRIYDPLNPESPFQYGGKSRLMPGTPILIWAEHVVNVGGSLLAESADVLTTEAGDQLITEDSAVTLSTYRLHNGTVDTWSSPWKAHADERRSTIVSSDAVKELVALDFGEQAPVGVGDTVDTRISRVLTHYAWEGLTRLDPSGITLQETTLAQSAWELIGRAAEDEIGFVYIDAWGVLQFHNRDTWSTGSAEPAVIFGCGPDEPEACDALIEAEVRAANLEIRNAVYATREGGVQQTSRSAESISLYGTHSYKRTDLGLQTDPQVAEWATYLVSLGAFPRATLEQVTIYPAFDEECWPPLLGLVLVDDRIRVLWSPPDDTPPVDTSGRAIGMDHRISRTSWETDIHLVLADLFGRVLHWGIHPSDLLDSGYVFR
jgi:hypothetical protein